MKKLFLFIILKFLIVSASAQSAQTIGFDAPLDSILLAKFNSGTPGVAVLVAKKGKIEYRKAFGLASLELSVGMRPEMLFNLGSITKQFTAVAVLQLMESGKLSLQDSIQKYIPKFPQKGYKITIENLLTHTSGIRDYMQMNDKDPFIDRHDFKPEELINYFKDEPLEFKPGSRYSYSNSGYVLLGYIIEQISGKSYLSYLQEYIFNPLGLNNTFYDSSNTILPGRTSGYQGSVKYLKADYWGASLPFAAGGLISNVDDLFRWHLGLLSGKVLKKDGLRKAFTPAKLKDGTLINYGYGWMLGHLGNFKSISHGGAMTGYRTQQLYYPDQDVYIVILANCDQAPTEELSTSISTLILGKSTQTDFKQNETVLALYCGVYELSEDPKRKISVNMENGRLVATTSTGQKLQFVFQSESKFEFKDISDAIGAFAIENNKTNGFVIQQNGTFHWTKIK
ncbi:serine hydrolase domain-containing protein [Pedobacter suwonensis]|uniref:serine hydrolase domain-containing protein n=1 Tax=Pedobacter suwonensis TaxID=332999 RepID=UPI00368EBA38